MKNKTIYVCTSCDYQSPKWLGQCPSCKDWNTFVEETYEKIKDVVGLCYFEKGKLVELK